jgi:hypothetical protein
VLVALQDALKERDGLLGVNVFRFGQKPETLEKKYIVLLANAPGSLTPRGFPLGPIYEEFTLHGVLCATGSGQGEDGQQDALEQAVDMLGELLATCIETDWQLAGICNQLLLTTYEHQPATDGAKYEHYIRFDIEGKSLNV